jgi:hypothetical protein
VMSAKHGPGIPDGSIDPTRARPRRLSAVSDQAPQTSGATEGFAVDWQLPDQIGDVS